MKHKVSIVLVIVAIVVVIVGVVVTLREPNGAGSSKKAADGPLPAEKLARHLEGVIGSSSTNPAAFESSIAKVKSLMSEGKFSEARALLRSIEAHGVAEHRKKADLAVEIARAAGASRSRGEGATNSAAYPLQ